MFLLCNIVNLRKYGAMGNHERSYRYEYNTVSGDKYTFIAVDACIDPGIQRPFNFFGSLYEVF